MTETADMTEEALGAWWRAWDSRPGADHAAADLEDAVQVFCSERSLDASAFREQVSRLRREGVPLESAIATAAGNR